MLYFLIIFETNSKYLGHKTEVIFYHVNIAERKHKKRALKKEVFKENNAITNTGEGVE